MKKTKQILAIIGVILLVGMYGFTIVAAFTASPNSPGLFLASIGATILIPFLIWGYTLIYKLVHKNDTLSDNEQENKSENNSTDSKE